MKISNKIKEIHDMFEVKDGDIIEVRNVVSKLYQVNDLMLESIRTGEEMSIAHLAQLEYNRIYTPISHRDALERLDDFDSKEVSILYNCDICQIELDDNADLLKIKRLGKVIKKQLLVGLYLYDCFVPVIGD